MKASAQDISTKVAYGSLAVGLVVLGLKAYAASATGSIALFSDALESVVNVVTALVALVAVKLAARPADASLPYGYHKAEYFSAVVIGIFIAVAAIVIFNEAWHGFFEPRLFDANPLGLGVSVAATGLNAVWAFFLIRTGKRHRSPSLSADGRHLATDVVSTLGVLIGVLLTVVTGFAQLDAILAGLVAITILWSGAQLIRQSVIGLMDVAVPTVTLNRIREIISVQADGAIEAHDIRTRQAGKATFIDFHLVVPGAHERGRRAWHLRPHRGQAARRSGGRHDHHPCRARGKGQAFRHRGGVRAERRRCA